MLQGFENLTLHDAAGLTGRLDAACDLAIIALIIGPSVEGAAPGSA